MKFRNAYISGRQKAVRVRRFTVRFAQSRFFFHLHLLSIFTDSPTIYYLYKLFVPEGRTPFFQKDKNESIGESQPYLQSPVTSLYPSNVSCCIAKARFIFYFFFFCLFIIASFACSRTFAYNRDTFGVWLLLEASIDTNSRNDSNVDNLDWKTKLPCLPFYNYESK